MYYSKIGNSGAGFTNQIFAFITSIINAFKNKNKVVVIDNFLNDIKNSTYSQISKIFDIVQINIFLKKNYDIIIVDKNNINFEILSVKYGTNETNYIDLTKFFKDLYLKNNKLLINKNICFNNIKGDPCHGSIKNFIIKYKINDYDIEEIYNENLDSNIEINFEKGPYIFTLGWINSFNDNMFDKILTNIVYNIDFTSKSELVINDINKNKKINIIHLRLEDDAIAHWSKINNIMPNKYKTFLEEKYINLFKKYISKTDEI